MKKHILPIIAATALLFGGCLPTEFIWWSPDGRTGAIRTSEGLRLSDANGRLSAVVLPGEIQSAAWLPDGSALIVSRSLPLQTNWSAIEKLIPPGEAAAAKELARAIPDLLKAALTASGASWDDVEEKFLKPLGMTESQALEPALFCAVSLYRQEILAAIAGFTNAAALEAEFRSSETNGIPVYEITLLSIRDGRPAGEPRALIRSLRPLLDPVPSPRHPILAFRAGAGALKAMSFDGPSSVVVAPENVPFAAWSADGGSLIHIVTAQTDKMGEIRSSTVAGADGGLLPEIAPAETLALAVFAGDGSPRLSVLPDGRVLFTSLAITLPARASLLDPAAQFFLLNPGNPDMPPVAVPITEGSLPDDLGSFAASPDGRFVAVVESGSDAVAVLEIATGKVKMISPSHAGWKSRMIPAWKNHRELTFAALPSSSAARPELFQWQADAPRRILSHAWPDEVVKQWLEAPQGSGE